MATRKNAKAKTQGVKPSRDVNAAVRVITALDLAIAGHDWQSIATSAGYASKGAAFNAVQRELERRIAPRIDTLRQMHYQRLQAFRQVYVPKALAGDGWSFDRCLRMDEREAALFGLDVVPAESQSAQMLIVAVPQTVIDAV